MSYKIQPEEICFNLQVTDLTKPFLGHLIIEGFEGFEGGFSCGVEFESSQVELDVGKKLSVIFMWDVLPVEFKSRSASFYSSRTEIFRGRIFNDQGTS